MKGNTMSKTCAQTTREEIQQTKETLNAYLKEMYGKKHF